MTTFSRRTFLLGAGATAGAVALGLPRVRRSRAQATGPARNLFLVFASGGWDTTYAIDPKPGLDTVDAPAGTLATYGDIDVWTGEARPAVAAYFAAHAAVTAIVRGVSVRSIGHPECQKRMLTGTPMSTRPDVGAIAGHELGRDLPLPYLVLGDVAFAGPLAASAGRVGITNQVTTLLDPAQAYPPPPDAPPGRGFVPSQADEELIRAFVQARTERERAVRGAHGYNAARIDDFETSLARGDRMRSVGDGFGARGATPSLAAQIDLGVRVVERGISRAVMIDSRGEWDTHADNADQDGLHQALFTGLRGLVDKLDATPGEAAGHSLLDESVVVVLSEMGRTPRQNGDGGKDHWPVTSTMIIGGGVRGGTVIGGTSDKVQAEKVDLATGALDAAGVTIQTDNLLAGLLELVGADPAPYFPDTEALRGFIA